MAPKASVTLTVTETSVQSSTAIISEYYPWLRSNIIDAKNPLASDKQIQACVNVQVKIDETQSLINEQKTRREELAFQAERVRENLSAAKDVGSSGTIAEWVKDLDDSEKEIRKI